jgi:hypothetical protein
MVMSRDIACMFLGSTGTIAWASVARGVHLIGQVTGPLDTGLDLMTVGGIEFCNGMPSGVGPIVGPWGFY